MKWPWTALKKELRELELKEAELNRTLTYAAGFLAGQNSMARVWKLKTTKLTESEMKEAESAAKQGFVGAQRELADMEKAP